MSPPPLLVRLPAVAPETLISFFSLIFEFCVDFVYFPGQGDPTGTSRSLKNGGLFPSTFNVATKAEIFANATCGEEGPETFCKPSESSRCAVCDARSPDPGKRHNISHVLNPDPGKWWQSPTLAQGDRFEYITIILDLGQVSETRNLLNFDLDEHYFDVTDRGEYFLAFFFAVKSRKIYRTLATEEFFFLARSSFAFVWKKGAVA